MRERCCSELWEVGTLKPEDYKATTFMSFNTPGMFRVLRHFSVFMTLLWNLEVEVLLAAVFQLWPCGGTEAQLAGAWIWRLHRLWFWLWGDWDPVEAS